MTPNLQNATLQIGSTVVHQIQAVTPWRLEYRLGTNRFFVLDDTVQHTVATATAPLWTNRSDDGAFLNWLAASNDVAYLLGYKPGKYGRFQGYESPPRLRRLDLKLGKWLPDVPIGREDSGQFETKGVVGVLPGDGGVIVLTGLTKKETSGNDRDNIDAFGLSLIKDGEAKASWTKEIVSAGQRPSPGAFMWGVPGPQYAGSDTIRLSWLGERLLVCPGAMEPIYCLNPDTGSEIWRVERLWEYRRGFIGPSVWSHYISRFGVEELGSSDQNIDEEGKAFDQKFQCALAGGPVIVPLEVPRREDTHSAFVAIIKGPAGGWAGYLSDCVLYELGDDGKPVSMGTLPQIVDGSQFCVRKGGVIWKSQNQTFIKAAPSASAPEFGMGPGGPDLLINLLWTRRVQYHDPQAWFVAGKDGDPAAFGEGYAYCVPGGGYVMKQGDKHYIFPLAAVDLSTGVDRGFVLDVPFEGQFSPPADNVSTGTSGNGVESVRALNPHLLAISGITAEAGDLEITLAGESNKWTLHFDIEKALQSASATPIDATADPREAARKRASQIEPKSLNEELQNAANGNDAAYVEALLHAGANPKYSSSAGWTALMVAAAYGTGQMVDALIAAGSDLNAADKNCGGQTVLMWAARSGKEAKHKVQSLLKAGANAKSQSQDGYNALMSAAAAGDLEVVECLLGGRVNVSARDKDGETVLMAGARSGKANIISVLLNAGAEIDAKDDEGMTALMRSADGENSAGAVVVLLKAGANPNLKDKKGRTALKIAEGSQMAGRLEVVKVLRPVTSAR